MSSWVRGGENASRHLFQLEQNAYESEGIDWAHVDFKDNQAAVDLLDARPPRLPGIFPLLDEACLFPQARVPGLCLTYDLFCSGGYINHRRFCVPGPLLASHRAGQPASFLLVCKLILISAEATESKTIHSNNAHSKQDWGYMLRSRQMIRLGQSCEATWRMCLLLL